MMKEIKEIYCSYNFSIYTDFDKVYKQAKTNIALARIDTIKAKILNLYHINIDKPLIENGEMISEYYPFSIENEDLEIYQIINYSLQICDAIEYLHEKDIYCIDLKIEHIKLNKNKNIKLIDCFEENTLSPKWAAPEYIFDKIKDKSNDIYSFGNILYFLNHKKLPFEDKNPIQYLINLKYKRPESNSIFKFIIEKCLEKNPENRFRSFDEIKTDLKALLQAS